MKKSLFIIIYLLSIIGCDTILTAEGIPSERLGEITLSENEKVIFSLLTDEVF
ncbi:hypothetical protein [Alkalihalobacillus deserti]|uniref:hypothetical protein n=1 Tax=Alkalihalobacillus deserti TaxID=2879466 RepID=UPI001D14F191|nr:hypothetical protein [Alkalihalobacillus deserti]